MGDRRRWDRSFNRLDLLLNDKLPERYRPFTIPNTMVYLDSSKQFTNTSRVYMTLHR
jgi:hypothetical protein